MNAMEKKSTPKPPQMSPYVFTFLLLGFGLWCFWDGWLTTNPDMVKHAMFNKVLSAILIVWGIWDFLKIRKRGKSGKGKE